MASQVLSADSHVLEPPDLWTTRMQRQFRDRAPHLIHEYNGQTGDFLACEGLRPFNPTSLGNAGIPPEEHEKFSRAAMRSADLAVGIRSSASRTWTSTASAPRSSIAATACPCSAIPTRSSSATPTAPTTTGPPTTPRTRPKRLFPIANISMTDPRKTSRS